MTSREEKIELVKKHVSSYPDFPIAGVLFRDIFAVLQKPDIFRILMEVMVDVAREITPSIQCVVGLDSRGFLFGPLLALELNVPFVPIRKKNKLPGEVLSFEYEKEYGKDILELQSGSIHPGSRVLIVDDLLATGGSMAAACELVKKAKGVIATCLVVMELEDLNGKEKIPATVDSLIKY